MFPNDFHHYIFLCILVFIAPLILFGVNDASAVISYIAYAVCIWSIPDDESPKFEFIFKVRSWNFIFKIKGS